VGCKFVLKSKAILFVKIKKNEQNLPKLSNYVAGNHLAMAPQSRAKDHFIVLFTS
jgi:hypothetical protein